MSVKKIWTCDGCGYGWEWTEGAKVTVPGGWVCVDHFPKYRTDGNTIKIFDGHFCPNCWKKMSQSLKVQDEP